MSYNANDNDDRQEAPASVFERVPDAVVPKQRSSAILRVLGSFLALSVVLAFSLIGLVVWGYSMFSAPGPLADKKVVMIPKDMERYQIVDLLKQEGVINDTMILNSALGLQTTLRGMKIKPGEYEFTRGQSMEDVLSVLRQGRTITYKLTIPEGWTTQMAMNRIIENAVLEGPAPATPPEGAMVTDTFVFQRGMTREQLVTEMKEAQTALLESIWSMRSPDSPIQTKEELVTMASIVEKETAKADERPLVAAVFLNRLKKGMRLQSDPTIIYGIVGGQGKLNRALTRADIEAVTPYNTYRVNGLPPGPIANPGRASLEAVMKPAPVEYLYFVADGTGGHAFANTLDEHNANVAKWRAIEADGGIAPAVPATVTDPKNTATGMEQLNLGPPQDDAAAAEAEKKKAEQEAKAEEPDIPAATVKTPTTEKKPADKRPESKKVEKKPVEKKVPEKKPELKKPELKKPELKKPAATKEKPKKPEKKKAETKPEEAKTN